jgi:acetylornithine deacetylase/succinyl-diaminopimelate desuccinylase-like protein
MERRGVIELIDKGVIRGDAAIVGEPTNLNISVGHRSRALLEVITRGRSAHASMPGAGVNAIEKMTKIIVALKKMKTGYDEILGKGTYNVGVIEGGTVANVVPDLCRILIDRRLTLGETPSSAEEDIKEIIGRITKEDGDMKAEVKCIYGWYPTLTSEKEPIVKVLSNSIEAVTKRRPIVGVSRFHTDGGFIHHMARIPVVIFGPGEGDLAHTANESVEISQVVEAAKIFALAIAEFMRS